MLLTKFEHAHMHLEQSGSRLVIDPGSFSAPPSGYQDVVAVVITHEHADHWTAANVAAALELSSEALVFTTEATRDALLAELPELTSERVVVVRAGDTVTVANFELVFHGGRHALLHSSIPIIDNFGVSVNDSFYFGGDTLEPPGDARFDVVAVPIGSPWSKISEVMDYVLEMRPRRVFTAHEMMLSVAGKALFTQRVEQMCAEIGAEFVAIEPHESVTV